MKFVRAFKKFIFILAMLFTLFLILIQLDRLPTALKVSIIDDKILELVGKSFVDDETANTSLEDETEWQILDPSYEEIIPFSETDAYKYAIDPDNFLILKNKLIFPDDNAYIQPSLIDFSEQVKVNLKTNLVGDKPRVLIYHTHQHEKYLDSKANVASETVVGIGELLVKELKKYGVNVIHDKTAYDIIDGEVNVTNSYADMQDNVSKILKKHTTIEVLIDIHRDGLPDGMQLTTTINDKPTALLMPVTGVSAMLVDGEEKKLTQYPNAYKKENFAFAIQFSMYAEELYPGIMRGILVKPYRYGLNMKPKTLLLEVGANTNTFEEARNTVEPIARILVGVLSGKM